MMQENLKSGRAVHAESFSDTDTRSPQWKFALAAPGFAAVRPHMNLKQQQQASNNL
ncbi:MAG TPA: hypothetical protein VMB80_02015 [Candidatus Acidoferrum sp.]|nr:hypothetical protein [Candidatus Acidoferrum sp.]